MTDEPEYEWDPEKSAWNERERGFGFELVYAFDFENALVVADERKDYGEPVSALWDALMGCLTW